MTMRRIVPVSLFNIELVPRKCRQCLYWESTDQKVSASSLNSFQKELQISEVASGYCEPGRVLLEDGKYRAYAQYGPPEFFPRSKVMELSPISPDALLLTCLHSSSDLPSEITQNLLLESAVDYFRKTLLIKKRGFKAVEAFALNDGTGCPIGSLDAFILHGFKILRQNDEGYLLRLELDQALKTKHMEAGIEYDMTENLPYKLVLNGRY